MGPLALSMVGVYALSPVLAKLLGPIVKPIYGLIGADPAMFAGTLLANDMGGWPLAQAMTDNPDAQRLSGLILGAMMGATIVFTIPVSLGIIDKSDRPFLAKGVLAGIVTIPIGVLVSGAAAGMPMGFVAVNTIPIVLTAALIAFGLWRAPDAMTKGFLGVNPSQRASIGRKVKRGPKKLFRYKTSCGVSRMIFASAANDCREGDA